MDQEKFEAEAVAQYWFTESEETLVVADHLSREGRLLLCPLLWPLGRREGAEGPVRAPAGSARSPHPQSTKAGKRGRTGAGRDADRDPPADHRVQYRGQISRFQA